MSQELYPNDPMLRIRAMGGAGNLVGIGGGGATLLSEAYAKLFRCAARGITPIEQVIASPPTLSVGAANTASTINGQTTVFGAGQYQANDTTKLDFISGRFASDGTAYAGVGKLSSIVTGARGGTAGQGIRFATDSANIDICVASTSGLAIYQTDYLSGLRTRLTANDYITDGTNTLGDSQRHYVKLAYPNATPKILEIAGLNVTSFRGLNVDNGYTIWRAPVLDQPNIVLDWDSWGFNVLSGGTNSTRLAVPQYLGERLGVQNIFSIASAGTGYLNTGGTNGTYRQRILAGDLDISNVGVVDFLIISDSLNDNIGVNAAYTDPVLAAEVTLTLELCLTKQPNAIIFVLGQQSSVSRIATQSSYDTLKAVVNSIGNNRLVYVDVSPSSNDPVYSSVTRTATTIGPDNAHANDVGKRYYGWRLGNAILKAAYDQYQILVS